MNIHLLNRFLELGPNRRVLTTLGKRRFTRRLCSHLSRSGAAFGTFKEAAAASARFHPGRKEHGNRDLMASNFQISARLRTSDYPVAFWIQKLAGIEPSFPFSTSAADGARHGLPWLPYWPPMALKGGPCSISPR